MNNSWHVTVYGKKNAGNVAKAFNAESLNARVERINQHISGESSPRPSQWFMVLVHNPGEESAKFAARCEAIYNNIKK